MLYFFRRKTGGEIPYCTFIVMLGYYVQIQSQESDKKEKKYKDCKQRAMSCCRLGFGLCIVSDKADLNPLFPSREANDTIHKDNMLLC
jgi:hypothetical protein